MGRGRAKAKQTKVARQLKYTTTGTDLDRLRAELTGGGSDGGSDTDVRDRADDIDDDDSDDDDPYADPYADRYAAAEDEEDEPRVS